MNKSDIARQFQLPERQSKLATMLREEGLRDEQVYCICRSTDVSRFMIGCDRCEEWYHGDCINVTEQESSKIRKFYCQKCRQKHSGLEIKYKPSKPHHHSHSKHHSDEKHDRRDKHSGHKSKKEKRRERCGECEACYIRDDCGRCEPCKDKPKFGGSGRLGQRCKKRQCTNFFHMAKKHSSHSRADHTYNTASPTKPPKPPKSPRKTTSDSVSKTSKHKARSRSRSPIEKPFEPKSCPVPLPTTPKRKRTPSEQSEEPREANVLRDRNDGSDQDLWLPKVKKVFVPKESKPRKKKDVQSRQKKPRYESSSESDEAFVFPIEQRQCFGAGCVKATRLASKYCSDECGLKLAEARLYSVLPQRIREWKLSHCVAEENDRKLLETIRKQQLTARDRLQELDLKHLELDSLLTRVKAVNPTAEGDNEEEEADYAVYCVTCGHEVASRRALKHMHHCYNKLESQMTFGSMFKTKIEGNNMFCDFFNPATQTYCKRLRVMCPEHVKEPKISTSEVCGFPLTEDLFDETLAVCRASRKKCIRHYCWDKLRRANIDMERVGQCLKLDELVERERQITMAITNRAGVLGLMLHSTYIHPLAETPPKHAHTPTKDTTPTKIARPQSMPNAEKPKAQPPAPTDHHYHKHQSKNKTLKAPAQKHPSSAQKYIVDANGRVVRKQNDHQYFNSHQKVDTKQLHDHMYFNNK